MKDRIEADIEDAQYKIAEIIKTLIYKSRPDLFEKLDYDNDNIFLEPLLFSFFKNQASKISLDQILFGYIEDQFRPEKIEVYADIDGIIYLPQFGYLKTSCSDRKLFLEMEEGNFLNYKLNNNSQTINFDFYPIEQIKSHKIEICKFNNELFRSLFSDGLGKQVDVEVENITKSHSIYLEEALAIIKSNNPSYYKLFISCIKKLVIYNSDYPNSFASMQAHGVAFFNTKIENGTIFFIDNIVHQCSHVIFNSLTFERDKYFKVDPDSSLFILTNKEEDRIHNLYGSFHGLFTQTNINTCFDICIDNKVFKEEEQGYELLGRFASNMNRFNSAIKIFDNPDIYTSEGLRWYKYFRKTYLKLSEKRKDLINGFDLSNQPYVFSFVKFLEGNPIQKNRSYLMQLK